MIAYLEGSVSDVVYLPKQVYIIVLTSGGLGYKIFVPMNSHFEIGESVKLFTSFQVREDCQNLFGFLSKKQMEMFENILNVSGIGPKVALSIVSNFSSSEFKDILASADYARLSKVQGLGQKGAKKIVLELQGIYVQEDSISIEAKGVLKDLREALKALGFRSRELEDLLKKGEKKYKDDSGKITIENLISWVLKND
jgi:holliday junction DNA helicase RuvA